MEVGQCFGKEDALTRLKRSYPPRENNAIVFDFGVRFEGRRRFDLYLKSVPEIYQYRCIMCSAG